MNRTRKWVTLLAVGIPFVILVLSMNTQLFSSLFGSTGAIYGRVTYNGKPLERGFVLFYPTDENSADWVVGTIGKDGTYRIESKWRHNTAKKQFRICIVPRRGKPAAHVEVPHEGSGPLTVPVELNSKSSDAHPLVAVNIGFPRRFTNVATSGLQITLGREPARIDIDLKD